MFVKLTDDNGVILGFVIVIIIILVTGFGIVFNLLNSDYLPGNVVDGGESFCSGANCTEFESSSEELVIEDISMCNNVTDINSKTQCYESYLDSSELKMTDCDFDNETLVDVCLDKNIEILFEKYADFSDLCSESEDKFDCFKKNSYFLILNYEQNNFECSDLDSLEKITDCETIIFSLNDKYENSNFYNFCPKLNNLEFREICLTDFERNII
jgi:hypothetical protein